MIRFLVYLEFIQKSLSFQLVKYCLPPFEGGLPFIEANLAVYLGVKKEGHSFEWSSYTPLTRFTCGYKKGPTLRLNPFIPLKRFKKKSILRLTFLYPFMRFTLG